MGYQPPTCVTTLLYGSGRPQPEVTEFESKKRGVIESETG